MRYFIALVWLVNGLLCKVCGLVPRHEAIVARILGEDLAPALTVAIGLAEIVMAIWILSRWQQGFNAVVQIVVILTMNLLESIVARDLLLWGAWNFVFALVFCGLIYYQEFHRHAAA
ncbi:DoxX-like family protein [Neolewinella lacunae]|uniref:DoxX-like family protein n=1 Tax=Neolewinella lacunae TaxID=1517758 RepID=A0A923PHP7_9BACT|nr:DoxX-like family protein [Neolewinella lacunae]MBC6994328.1 DoxX-like family protein [Neolewinella lacunae]MDN3635825.1 DoxX-like family protein [Neolewinella lacunae]